MNSETSFAPRATYELPETAETLNGYSYCPSDSDWVITTETGRRNFHFGDLAITESLMVGFKGFLVARLRSGNARTAYADYQLSRLLLLHIATRDPSAKEISPAHLINYRSSLPLGKLHRATNVNNAVRNWARLGIPGVSKAAFITAIDLPKTNSPRALAVRLRSPEQGAYTNLEYDGLYRALHAGFARGEISLENYSLCLLSGALGPRPIQLASLRVGDLKVAAGPAGKSYCLSVPRAKQRGGGYRTEFTDRPLIEDIGMVVEAQADQVRQQAFRSKSADPECSPLFPAVHVSSTFYESGGTPVPPTSASIAMRIINVMEGLGVMSERTGKPINVNATRARRTAGTRAAQEGKSLEEIASVLDHTSITAARCYVEIRSELLQRLDKKMAHLLAPLAQRFAGELSPRDDGVGSKIARHVFGTVNEDGALADVGGCGKHGYCGLGKPIACYTCRLFHPWLDGPHEAVLDSLLERRERLTEAGSHLVASTLDDTILACAEVVRQCVAHTPISGETG